MNTDRLCVHLTLCVCVCNRGGWGCVHACTCKQGRWLILLQLRAPNLSVSERGELIEVMCFKIASQHRGKKKNCTMSLSISTNINNLPRHVWRLKCAQRSCTSDGIRWRGHALKGWFTLCHCPLVLVVPVGKYQMSSWWQEWLYEFNN